MLHCQSASFIQHTRQNNFPTYSQIDWHTDTICPPQFTVVHLLDKILTNTRCNVCWSKPEGSARAQKRKRIAGNPQKTSEPQVWFVLSDFPQWKHSIPSVAVGVGRWQLDGFHVSTTEDTFLFLQDWETKHGKHDFFSPATPTKVSLFGDGNLKQCSDYEPKSNYSTWSIITSAMDLLYNTTLWQYSHVNKRKWQCTANVCHTRSLYSTLSHNTLEQLTAIGREGSGSSHSEEFTQAHTPWI